MELYYLCVFDSKNYGILIYTKLEDYDSSDFKLLSTPCSIKTGCTYSIKITHKEHIDIVLDEVRKAKMREPKIFAAQKINGKIKYKEIFLGCEEPL